MRTNQTASVRPQQQTSATRTLAVAARGGFVIYQWGSILLLLLASLAEVRADTMLNRQQQLINYCLNFVPDFDLTGASPHRVGRVGFWDGEGRIQGGDITNGTNFIAQTIFDACDWHDPGFSLWAGMDAFYRVGHLYNSDMLSHTYGIYTICPHYDDQGTENLRFMAATGRYLAGAHPLFTGATFSNTNIYNTGDPTARTYLLGVIQQVPRYGLREQNSAIYEHYTLGPIRTLAEFSPDLEVRAKAGMAWEWGVAEAAGTWLNGHWCIPSQRGYQPTQANGEQDSGYPWWLMFGGPTPSSLLDALPSVLYCMDQFQGVSPEILAAATTRDRNYTHHTTCWRSVSGHQIATYKQSWMTPKYSLFSQFEIEISFNPDWSFNFNNAYNYKPATLADMPQGQRWGILWDDPNPSADAGVWITNPSYPLNPYVGINLYERTFQSEDTLVGVYNIPTNAGNQFVSFHIPGGKLALINESTAAGRFFVHYTNLLLAVQFSENFAWDGSTVNFDVNGNKFGLAVETAAQSDYTNALPADRLAAFRSDVLARLGFNAAAINNINPRLLYTNRHGAAFDLTFGQCPRLNDENVDFLQWPTLSNPWMHQSHMGNLFVFGTNRTLLHDYNAWIIRTNYFPVVTDSSPAECTGPQGVQVDLAARVSDAEIAATNLLYLLLGASNGVAALQEDGHTMLFTPAANFNGVASFTYAACDRGVDPRLVLNYQCDTAGSLGGTLPDDSFNYYTAATVQTLGGGSAAYATNAPTVPGNDSRQSLRLVSTASSGARLTVPNYPSRLSLTNGSWTFSAWFQRAAITDEDFILYVGAGDGGGGDGDALQVYCPADANTVGVAHYNAASVLDVNLISGATAPAGEWHHLAVTFEKVADRTGHVRLYVNGTPAGVASNVVWSLRQDLPLVFGGHSVTNTSLGRCFNGWLDDLALFRGALDAGEIARLAAVSVASFGGHPITNTISVNVTAGSSAPLAYPDSYTVAANSAGNILTPLDNDVVQMPGGTLSIVGLAATNGTAVIVGGTNVSFTPVPGFAGTATIGYTITDNVGGTNTSLITVAVADLQPVANPDSYAAAQNSVANVLTPLLNDVVQAPGGILAIVAVTPTNGVASIGGGTNVLFTPATNFIGMAAIGYTITDGVGGTNSSLVTITVTNRPPVANPDSYTVVKNSANNVFQPLLNDVLQTPGGILNIITVTPTNGTASIVGGTNVLFSPKRNFTGTASVGYRITDSLGGTNASFITVTVTRTALSLALASVVAPAPVLSGDHHDGQWKLTITGPVNAPFRIEKSTDLQVWSALLSTNLDAAGEFEWTDSEPHSSTQQFYRAVLEQ